VSLVGRPARNHPQQAVSDEVDDRGTTAEVFGPLNERFGGFTVDVAAAAHNTKCERFYDRHTNGLEQSWASERVWCNPPYSHPNLARFTAKAWAEHQAAECIVMLVPANRTDQQFWTDLVEPYRDQPGSPLTVELLPGRLRFLKPGRAAIGPNERPPFGCCLLIWQHTGPSPEPTLFGPSPESETRP